MNRNFLLIAAMLGGLVVAASGARAADVETPRYDVVSTHEGYEIRRYGPLTLVTKESRGDVNRAMYRSFMSLADFIGGENEKKEEIAMTAPVIAVPPTVDGESLDVFRVSFILPSKYADGSDVPAPTGEGVSVQHLEGLLVAAVQFSGMGGTSAMEAKWTALQAALKRDGVKITGAPMFAKYNPPWTLPWNRRNEVMAPLELAAKDAKTP